VTSSYDQCNENVVIQNKNLPSASRHCTESLDLLIRNDWQPEDLERIALLVMNTRVNSYQPNRHLNIANVADEKATLWRRQRTSTVHVRAHQPVRGISYSSNYQSVTTADWLQAIGSIIWRFYRFLGALAQLRNAPISVVKPVRHYVRLSARISATPTGLILVLCHTGDVRDDMPRNYKFG
jgi:hypothetical protein